MRTVKRQILPPNKNKQMTLNALCLAYTNEKAYFLDLLREWDLQSNLGMPRKIRDELVKSNYTSRYGLQARHWKLALQDAIETWDKYWAAIWKQVRSRIARAKMVDEERHFAYWLLKGYFQFAKMMKGDAPQPPFEISHEAMQKVAGYVRRTVKSVKGKPPSVRKSRIAKFDANCYEVFENEGRQYIKLMTLKKGNRLCLPLSGKAKIEGTITIVLSKEGVSLHVPNALKPHTEKKGSLEAVDFGYTEVMTDTEGVRYGKNFGKVLTKTSDDLHEKMQKRHKIHACAKKNPQKGSYLKFNLGRQKLTRKKKASRSTLEKEINTAINELIHTKNPAILITEDLSHLFTYDKSKAWNRRLSSWMRGFIQERVSFKALAEGFRHQQVNSAYGSQSCPCCLFVDQRNRSGDSFTCTHCGHEDIADRVAALNYAGRYGDQEIGQYTPYCQVKTILLDRFHRRLEMEQSMTVPGRTLETVNLMHPPPDRDYKPSHSRERQNLEDRAVNQRAKQQ